MSKFKPCKREELTEDPDEAAFSISYTEDMKEIILKLRANRPLSPEEYVASLADFVDAVLENPVDLFEDESGSLH